MTNATETKALPAYRIYSVSNGGEKAVWAEIGAAWKHKDGKGLTLQFKALPLEGAQTVLREPTAKKEPAKSSRRMKDRSAELSAEA